MGATFSSASPMDVRKRTVLSDSALLATSSDWTSLATGPGNTNGFPGFSSGSYILTLILQRTGPAALRISMSWLNPANSASLTTSVTDATATNFNFDGLAWRPAGSGSTATTITFNEVKVEFIPGSTPPSVSLDPQDQSVFVGQSASFAVLAGGTPPLNYQWYYNTNTILDGATNATLSLASVDLTNAGGYSVLVSNDYGAVTSAVAQLTVTAPVSPSIVVQPQDQTALPGGGVTFSVIAGGSEPLTYQWYYNTNTPLSGATDSLLILTNLQPSDAGAYSVVVSNLAGEIASSNAVLFINTNPVAPVFLTRPASQVVLIGGSAVFQADAAGTAPISYQWRHDGVLLNGAMGSLLALTNVQPADSGSYSVQASNGVGTVMSDAAVLTVIPSIPVPATAYNLAGFAQGTTGGGVLPDTDPNYAKVFTATDLANALNSKTVKVIEIMNDLNLGFNEIEASAKATSEPFRAHNPAQLHPVLLTTGVSLIDIQKKNGLTIFSANGATIRHATFNVKSSGNVIIRNLKFDQMWEWDEASKGNYDKNDWDFIDLGNSGTVSNIWIDHCTFTKSYDGIVDIKGGSYNITFSWCKYTGDDGASNTNSWVRQQINFLEQSPASYPMYNFLRTHGFSVEDIVTIIQGHDKTHLIGATTDSANAAFRVTFHHDWFANPWDRLPRLRAGNVHNYNIYVDDALGLAARRLRDARAAALSTADQNTLNNTYSFKPFLNGSISTEGGAVLVEKSVYIDCLTPLRNNQTDPSNPFYTGKILALDTIYQMDDTVIRGDSTDTGNPLGPFQAPVIPFSWNLPGNALPYSYSMDDPAQLQAIVTSPTTGAGAGVLIWAKTNWLAGSYAPSGPSIVADPQGQVLFSGATATFTVVAGGSTPLSYRWYFNTNSAIPDATNSTFSLADVQTANAGSYSVVVNNAFGSVTSQAAPLILADSLSGFQAWQALNFTVRQLGDPTVSSKNATPAGDAVANFVKYALGLPPLLSASQPLVGFRVQGSDTVLTYSRPSLAPDVGYMVDASTNLPDWSTLGVTQQAVGTNAIGLESWEAIFSGPPAPKQFLRLSLEDLGQ
jgi:pectate lyase